ncbi:MAG: YgzB family protein [Clostridium sp.]|nr:YgzB family protein [Clostridium sp.]
MKEKPFEEHDSDRFCPECGKELAMAYIYDMCAHCMDELIERKPLVEDYDSDKFCPKCRRKLDMAIYGTQKLEDTRYKIILKGGSIIVDFRRERFLKTLMKIGNISYEEALEKYHTKNSLIFEGDARGVYISDNLLHGFSDAMKYEIIPEFPFQRCLGPFYSICPTCGSDTVWKEDGCFCEKCNKWLLGGDMIL